MNLALVPAPPPLDAAPGNTYIVWCLVTKDVSSGAGVRLGTYAIIVLYNAKLHDCPVDSLDNYGLGRTKRAFISTWNSMSVMIRCLHFR